MNQVERGDAIMPTGKRVAVLASTYAWQFGSEVVPVAVDASGNATSIAPEGQHETPTMLFERLQFVEAVIGIMVGSRIVVYEGDTKEHLWPDAFKEKHRPARLTVPTLLYDDGRRRYFFRAHLGPSPLPFTPETLRRLESGTIIALPTEGHDTHSRFETPPNDWGLLTFDPFMSRLAPQSEHVERMGRTR